MRLCAALCLCIAAVPLTGCAWGPAGRLDVWAGEEVYGGLDAASAGRVTDLYDAQQGRITLAGAIDETLSFCLVLSARDRTINGLTVEPGDLRSGDGRIPANAVTLYRVDEVELGPLPGWHIRGIAPQHRVSRVPDVLIPVNAPKGGLPAKLSTRDPLTLWVDIHIPKGTAPGTYQGDLTATAGDETVQSIGLRVTVWPFVLPEPNVVLLADLDHQSLFARHLTDGGRAAAPLREWGAGPQGPQLDDLLYTTCRLLWSHQVTPLLTKLTPVVQIEGDGQVTVDWTDYDRVVGSLLNGEAFHDRRPLPMWRIPFDESFPPPPEHGALTSPTYSRMARQYLTACAQHFAERGWLDRSFVRLPYASSPGAEAYAAIRHFGRIARGADSQLRTLAEVFPQDAALYGWEGFAWEDVGSFVDIWSPPAQFFDPARMRQERMRGKHAFWRLDRPPFSGSIEQYARPADVRVIAWQARANGIEAVQLGPADHWPDDRRAVTPQACCDNRVAPIIYPGRFCGLSSPIPSVRLKRLRRSMQDAAYLTLASELGLDHLASTLTESLAPRAGVAAYGAHFADGVWGGWTEDPELWSAARRILADEIVRRVRRGRLDDEPAAGRSDRAEDVANAVQWRRLIEYTRRVLIDVDGVRVRPVGPAMAGAVEVAIAVTVTNRTRAPISGHLAFEELPLTWTAQTPQVPLPEIAPQASRRLTLRATAAVLETEAGAVRYLPLVLETSEPRTYRFSARLCSLAAHPLRAPLAVDGDLSDWPIAVGNAAEDFVLIVGEDAENPRLPQSRPTHATRCFVATDGQALYFGFDCAVADGGALPRQQRSFVRYDDGVPVGDELVEILIDPTNTGTRSTSDLFHIGVKPSGWSCERGIGTDPPTGARAPWAADVRVAVRVHSDRWAAEVRVPLDAFGARLGRGTVWGLNLTRFDQRQQEFSNWSGAEQNVYDPLALGNLALP
ncbi:MAG TPA: hypothetical protein VM243_21270 [Phycisphaerae bacterium]|nr:hypothetical protein [Phycisphaerae bacterium]